MYDLDYYRCLDAQLRYEVMVALNATFKEVQDLSVDDVWNLAKELGIATRL